MTTEPNARDEAEVLLRAARKEYDKPSFDGLLSDTRQTAVALAVAAKVRSLDAPGHAKAEQAAYERGYAELAERIWPLKPPPTPDPDGWIKWEGGECPVPNGVEYRVRFVDGREPDSNPPSGRNWSKEGCIIAYRLASPPTPVKAKEPWEKAREAYIAAPHPTSGKGAWQPVVDAILSTQPAKPKRTAGELLTEAMDTCAVGVGPFYERVAQRFLTAAREEGHG